MKEGEYLEPRQMIINCDCCGKEVAMLIQPHELQPHVIVCRPCLSCPFGGPHNDREAESLETERKEGSSLR